MGNIALEDIRTIGVCGIGTMGSAGVVCFQRAGFNVLVWGRDPAKLERLPAAHEGTARARLRALLREHVGIAVREYPAALRLFLVPRKWPDAQRARIKELRRRHDQVFRTVIEDGVAAGEFVVTGVGTVLQCMHAAMSQAPLWCGELRGAAQDAALDELVDTLMMLVGVRPGAR